MLPILATEDRPAAKQASAEMPRHPAGFRAMPFDSYHETMLPRVLMTAALRLPSGNPRSTHDCIVITARPGAEPVTAAYSLLRKTELS